MSKTCCQIIGQNPWKVLLTSSKKLNFFLKKGEVKDWLIQFCTTHDFTLCICVTINILNLHYLFFAGFTYCFYLISLIVVVSYINCVALLWIVWLLINFMLYSGISLCCSCINCLAFNNFFAINSHLQIIC